MADTLENTGPSKNPTDILALSCKIYKNTLPGEKSGLLQGRVESKDFRGD